MNRWTVKEKQCRVTEKKKQKEEILSILIFLIIEISSFKMFCIFTVDCLGEHCLQWYLHEEWPLGKLFLPSIISSGFPSHFKDKGMAPFG